MNTVNTEWQFDEVNQLHIQTNDGTLTGYRIEPPDPDHHLHPVLGDTAGHFTLILPRGEGSVTYETLEQAKEAAEVLYQARPTVQLPSAPLWCFLTQGTKQRW